MNIRMKTPLTAIPGTGFDQVLWDDIIQLLIRPYVALRIQSDIREAPAIACRGAEGLSAAVRQTEHAAPDGAMEAYRHGLPVPFSPLETVLLWADALDDLAKLDHLPLLSDFAANLRRAGNDVTRDLAAEGEPLDARAAIRSMADRLMALCGPEEEVLMLTGEDGTDAAFVAANTIILGDRTYVLFMQENGDDLTFAERIDREDVEPVYSSVDDPETLELLAQLLEEMWMGDPS